MGLSKCIDSDLKENAEIILSQLGLTPTDAIKLLYKQIELRGGLPFEIKLPAARPIALGSLTASEFDTLMEKAYEQYRAGDTVSANDVAGEMKRKYGI